MKEYYRQQAKLKSDQELQQKHPSNRSSVPSESILYRLHNAISNDEDGKNRPRLDDASETSTKLSILDHMPSLTKTGRRVSRAFSIDFIFSALELDPALRHLLSFHLRERKTPLKNEPALMSRNFT